MFLFSDSAATTSSNPFAAFTAFSSPVVATTSSLKGKEKVAEELVETSIPTPVSANSTDTEETVPTQQEMIEIWTGRLQVKSNMFRKEVKVKAKVAEEGGELETVVDGVVETTKAYSAGDVIVVNPGGERYSMSKAIFDKRYYLCAIEECKEKDSVAAPDGDGFVVYSAKGKVWATAVTGTDMQSHFPKGSFIASWGSEMKVSEGDMLAMPCPDGGEVYRIEQGAFNSTYVSEESASVSR